MGVSRNRVEISHKWSRSIALVILTGGGLIMLIPLLWMISTSLKTFTEVMSTPPVIFPKNPQWENYFRALTTFNFILYLRNSLVVVILSILGTLLSTSMAAYAFARLRSKGKETLFMVLLSTIMLPPQITIIPVFWLYVQFGWINTLYPLFVPSWFGVNVFAIFLLRQFFMTIPQDYLDAARIDGASEWTILFRIIYSLSKPALLTILVFTFIGSWNDLWTPLIFIHRDDLYTLPVALISFLATTIQPQGMEWQLMMAASTIIIIPLIIVFFFTQRYFIEGITMSGIKG